MKFNTKLTITSVTVIVLPFLLALLSYWIIGWALSRNLQENYGIDKVPVSVVLNPTEVYNRVTDDYFSKIGEMAENDVAALEDITCLQKLDDELSEVSSSLIVKKGKDIYYCSEDMLSDPVISYLAPYGNEDIRNGVGDYYQNISRLVKQKDFRFRDGTNGSVYLVTKVNLMISQTNLSGLFISLVCVLILTSILLTAWLRRSIFKPFAQLKDAMDRIAAGNFDEPLVSDERGEIKELFDNFETMRIKLKNTADEKKETDRSNRELVSNISHDLKTPITSIKGYMEGIMDGVADSPEKMERYIRTVYNKANDMDHLIDELMVYSKLDANKIPYQFRKISVEDYFGDCADEVGLDLEAKGIRFSYVNLLNCDEWIYADPEQLKRVINNIINNSVKYSDKKNGRIRLEISKNGEEIEITISDNGRGIPKEEIEIIFERFYRTDASRNSSKGGSGIGLSIAKKIVEEHGGRIWATGEEGKGVAIHFTLKKYQEPVVEEETITEKWKIKRVKFTMKGEKGEQSINH